MRSSTKHQRTKRSDKTGKRATNRGDVTPDVHSMLWSSYFQSDDSSQPVPDPTHPTLGRGITPIPALLKSHQDKIPKPLLAIAVWNQVPNINPDSNAPPPILDDTLKQLLASVLDLHSDDVSALRANQFFAAVPPYPNQVILDALYVEQPRAEGGASARLEICVPTPLNDDPPRTHQQSTFERLRKIADPRKWSDCHLFWSEIERRDPRSVVKEPKAKRFITARLHLPGKTIASSEKVKLDLLEFSDSNPLRTRLRFKMHENKLIKACHGYITVQKEHGRPGAARVINQKVVQFARSPLDDHTSETLKYWLQAETILLVTSALKGVDA